MTGETDITEITVLIVAKCIVNHDTRGTLASILDSINSSKVYCKYFRVSILFLKSSSINSSKVYCKFK